MLSRRRLPLAAFAFACLIAASGASADPLDTFVGTASPSVVTPSTTSAYTVSLTSSPLSANRALRASIVIPSGFDVAPASVQATTTAVAGSCDAATWEADGAIIADQKIQVRRPGADSNALCPGATLTVTFTAVSAATEGTYAWPSALVNDVSGSFALVGAPPNVVVDGTAPTAAITGKPGNPSNDRSPSFVFSAGEPSTFECKLDAAAFAPCSSPKTYTDLADGNHTVSVRATDSAGNVGSATSYAWTIDTDAPTATITTRPANPTSSTAPSFGFTANETGSSFSCRLDGGAFEPCPSPKGYTGLGDGLHTFEVKATDQAGNTGTVDAFAWTIDTVAPTASISTKPANPSRDSSPSFGFSANEGGSSFSCRLDAQAFAACVSVKSYPALPDGQHTFAVRATDAAGNTGSETTYGWTIDTVAPTVSITVKPANPSKDATPSFSYTSSEAGSSFTCRLDAGAPGPCASPTSYAALPDGPHTFQVRATDGAGNVGVDTSHAWRIDTVAPTATITQPPSNPSNDTSPRFAFSANEAGSNFECKLDAAPFAACTSPRTYTGVLQGQHTFTVRAIDPAGNAGPVASYGWAVDTTAPTAEITQTPTDPSNSNSPAFAFTAADATEFQCKLDTGAFAACTSPKGYANVPDGRHAFVVRARDAAGNTSAEAGFTWVIDTVAPTAAITAKPANPSRDSSPSFAFSASENGSTFLCRVDAQAPAACDSPKTFPSLGQGAHTFAVKATDRAGNAGAETTYAWTIDTVAPTTSITGQPTDPTKESSATFTFTVNETGSTLACRLDAGAFEPCTSPKAYTGLADGQHTFAVRATDPAGNQGAADTHAWKIDTTPPTSAITDRPGSLTNDGSATFSFTASELGSSFSCRIDAAAFAACTSPKTYTLGDGAHTFAVRATDALGNVGPAASFAWTIDTVAPSVQITQKPGSPSNVRSPSFSFTSSEAGSAFSCRLEEGGFTPCTSPKGYANLPDGQHAFAVKATDAAGNTGAAATHTWTIDTVAPTAAITGRPSNPSSNRSPSFSFTASEEGSTFACRLDGGGFAACAVPAAYSSLADGPHTFAVRATDPAGNAGPEASYGWTIETRAPTAALVSGPPGLGNSSAAVFAFSADEPSSFDCNLDGRGFEPCSSPATYHGLADGAHAFSVRAKDASGNLSAPVGHSWTIDTTAPETTLAEAPSSGTATSATFAYAASERATFECRLDGTPFTVCGSPRSYAGLAQGDHQFQVRAVDAAGNADPTPSLHGWRVQAPAARKVASALQSPKAGARVRRPPLLVWRRVAGARYYNVQVFRGRKKVFTGWPTRTRLQLRAKWTNRGRTERLLPGRYRWFVWPGYTNPRRYGALLGQSTFTVTRR